MKGLLYKDLTTNKGNIFGMAFVLSYMITFLCVSIEEVQNGNEGYGLVMVMLLGSVFAVNLVFPWLFFDASIKDVKTKWNTYALALPGGYKRLIRSKYLLSIMGQTFAVIVSLVLIAVCKKVCSFEADMFIMFMLILMGIVLLIAAILMPFVLKGKIGLVQIIFWAVVVLTFYGLLAYAALGDISFFKQGNLMLRIMTWIAKNEKKIWAICWSAAVAGVLAEFISYVYTVKTYFEDK